MTKSAHVTAFPVHDLQDVHSAAVPKLKKNAFLKKEEIYLENNVLQDLTCKILQRDNDWS